MEFAVEQLGTERGPRELDKFRDYWCAKSGADGTKLDWEATWRNWVRKAAEQAPPGRKSPAARSNVVDEAVRLINRGAE
jgi:hypothetical protein